MKVAARLLALLAALPSVAVGQSFYFGNDLSYVNQMEDCGAVYREHGEPKDPYQVFADRGSNLVRVRLWVDPSWWQSPLPQPAGVKPFYSDLEDVKTTIRRAREAGMHILLDIHYSDFWADPGRQLIPRAWLDVAYDLEALEDTVYAYTSRVLLELDQEGLMPELVQIGNETNPGVLVHVPQGDGFNPGATVSNSWTRHAQLFNAAIRAVRDVGETASINPKIALHFSGNLSGQRGRFQNALQNGITDVDILGISYYYAWHGGNIAQLESTIRLLATTYPDYEIMVLETAYLWTTRDFDALPNIVTTPDPEYIPVIPEKQLEYLTDYTRAVMRAGGTGVIFWEPAWVSTPCRTPWGQGSSHDHVAFFDPWESNFIESGGGRWMERHFYEDLDALKITFKVDMTGENVSQGVYLAVSFGDGDWQVVRMIHVGSRVYGYYTYLPEGSEGQYHFMKGADGEVIETVPASCASSSGTDRAFSIAADSTEFAFRWSSCDPPGVISSAGETAPLPTINLHPAYPNPFHGSITITYELPYPADVSIVVFDALGRKVRTLTSGHEAAGRHEVLFEARDLPSGLYLCRITVGPHVETLPLVLTR